ncbi:hypothetical protein SAMN05660443_1221 [Marinospirillum celere]|uniref:Uncharacterized protein n=1 Tax=Marinospirillum celere TaxID=1122252 RepID=A0A1I1G1I6_9GAMM|nr:hypothetical protein [Marinospirillum celere]SFC03040.1 hypothetical protein SAMN05660443_1221 [Marinospirillum celere]
MGLLESIRTLTWCQLLASGLFALLSAWYFYSGNQLLALAYLTGLLFISIHLFTKTQLAAKRQTYLGLLAFSAYCLVSLTLLLLPEHYQSLTALSLHLAFPFLAFSLLPFRPALLFVLGFTLVANLLAMIHLDGSFRFTFLTALWLVTLMTSVYSFTHELRQQNLYQLLSRNPETGLFNRKQLAQDLEKEQQRALREGTALAIFELESQESPVWSKKQLQDLLSVFAAYERIYHFSSKKLLILAPIKEQEQLQERSRQLEIDLDDLKLHSYLCPLDALPARILHSLQSDNKDMWL